MTTPSVPGTGLPAGPGGTPGGPEAADATPRDRAMIAVATFADYASAQRAVDYLSDNKFPVEHTAIIGTGLSLVENVLGRTTVWRSALAGAAGGAWFGLFIGLLLGIFSDSNWFAVMVIGLVVGALWGAVFGAIAQAATRGRRDFTSRSTLQATEYAVSVDAERAEQARQLLVRPDWRAGADRSA
jgi:hypothetical protein